MGGASPSHTLENSRDYVAIASVPTPQFGDRTLVLKEVGQDAAGQLLKEPEANPELEAADVAAFVFDGNDPKSFNDAQNLMLQVMPGAS